MVKSDMTNVFGIERCKIILGRDGKDFWGGVARKWRCEVAKQFGGVVVKAFWRGRVAKKIGSWSSKNLGEGWGGKTICEIGWKQFLAGKNYWYGVSKVFLGWIGRTFLKEESQFFWGGGWSGNFFTCDTR